MNEIENEVTVSEEMPLLALRGLTVFPEMVMSFDVERAASLAAVNAASEGNRKIFLVAQKDVLKENPAEADLFRTGTVCLLRQFLRSPNGGIRVMVEGVERAKMLAFSASRDYFTAEVIKLPVREIKTINTRIEALLRQTIGLYEEFSSLSGNAIPETLISLAVKNDPGYVADYITQNIFLKHTEKQLVLETLDPVRRLQIVSGILGREIEVLSIEHQINEKLHEQLVHIQRENVLREQMKVISAELGEENGPTELDGYRERILQIGFPKETEEKLLKEVDRLSKQPFGSAESSVLRSYLDLCLELPWNRRTKERLDLKAARKILDEDHFGLEKVKQRIIEFLAVKKLAPDMKGSILCLVGPPGVGKTSVAMSIARATNRKLARMSLGGVHDEAEIRGHRKTYIGAMPGRIITALSQAGSMNPLMLLDEIDKLGSDYRGDPSAALLEALDPEQNSVFRDHYMEIPVDLSQVFFITTANTTDTIPRPLLDRVEVIELPSYTDEEKLQIAKEHLLPKQRKKHGLNARQLKIGDDVLREVIAGYTRESGVRQFERCLAALCRKTAAEIVENETKSVTVTGIVLEKFLGPRKYKLEKPSLKDEIGLVKGLAWTSSGGEILEVEAIALDGTGKLELTGNLGDVMKESAHAAVSYIRSRAEALGIDRNFYKNRDIHIHFPEGAVPKDGPSAGITVAIAVISALTKMPVRHDIAMTGEITLTGRILPIGGLKEKTMAALRAGVRTVIIPAENEPDLEDIDQTVRRALNFITTAHIDAILETVLLFPKSRETDRREEKLPPDMLLEKSEHGAQASIRQ